MLEAMKAYLGGVSFASNDVKQRANGYTNRTLDEIRSVGGASVAAAADSSTSATSLTAAWELARANALSQSFPSNWAQQAALAKIDSLRDLLVSLGVS
jgi:hypothetical protein